MLNPPRSGLKNLPDFFESSVNPRTVYYISCNPENFTRDARVFCNNGGLNVFNFWIYFHILHMSKCWLCSTWILRPRVYSAWRIERILQNYSKIKHSKESLNSNSSGRFFNAQAISSAIRVSVQSARQLTKRFSSICIHSARCI